jgi:hypothetical protein
MRLPLPGPRAVLQPVRAVSAAIRTCGAAVTTVVELVPQIEQAVMRATSLLGDAERSAPRVGVRLGEVEAMVDRLFLS